MGWLSPGRITGSLIVSIWRTKRENKETIFSPCVLELCSCRDILYLHGFWAEKTWGSSKVLAKSAFSFNLLTLFSYCRAYLWWMGIFQDSLNFIRKTKKTQHISVYLTPSYPFRRSILWLVWTLSASKRTTWSGLLPYLVQNRAVDTHGLCSGS